MAKRGTSCIQGVDVSNRPQFGLGNGSKDRCISTTQLRVTANDKPGTLQIHALDRGSRPILLSIQTLLALKAVIDFDEDLLVLRGLDATKIIANLHSLLGMNARAWSTVSQFETSALFSWPRRSHRDQ